MRRSYNFTSTPVDTKLFIVLFQMVWVVVIVMPLLDATSFENGYRTTEALVCSAVSKERDCNSCAMYTQFHVEPPSWVSIYTSDKKFEQRGRICKGKSRGQHHTQRNDQDSSSTSRASAKCPVNSSINSPAGPHNLVVLHQWLSRKKKNTMNR